MPTAGEGEVPIPSARDMTGVPGECHAWLQLVDILKHRLFTPDILEGKIFQDAFHSRTAGNQTRGVERFDLRRKGQSTLWEQRIIERFYPIAIAGQGQRVRGFVPDGDGKHAVQPG